MRRPPATGGRSSSEPPCNWTAGDSGEWSQDRNPRALPAVDVSLLGRNCRGTCSAQAGTAWHNLTPTPASRPVHKIGRPPQPSQPVFAGLEGGTGGDVHQSGPPRGPHERGPARRRRMDGDDRERRQRRKQDHRDPGPGRRRPRRRRTQDDRRPVRTVHIAGRDAAGDGHRARTPGEVDPPVGPPLRQEARPSGTDRHRSTPRLTSYRWPVSSACRETRAGGRLKGGTRVCDRPHALTGW